MIKNIIFDLGKVLIDYDFDIFFSACGLQPECHDLIQAEPLILLFDRGKINRQSFYLELKKIFSFQLSQQEFEKAWCSIFWQNTPMITLAKQLKLNYHIFILSNTDEIHFPYIWKNFPALHIFKDNIVLSYQVGYVKPDYSIYRKALEQFDISPVETVFIDDKAENVEAAEKVSISSILHLSNKKTGADISKLLTS